MSKNKPPLLHQWLTLLKIYNDMQLAIQLDEYVTEHNVADFARQFLKSKVDDDNRAWLQPHLHEILKIKSRSFATNVNNDHQRILTIAANLARFSNESDETRFSEMIKAVGRHMLIHIANTDEVQIPTHENRNFETKGLFFVMEEQLEPLSAKNKMEPTDTIKCACIANSGKAYHSVIDELSAHGFSFIPQKFRKGENHIFDLNIDHESDAIKDLEFYGSR